MDFENHLRRCVDLPGGVNNFGAGRAVSVVGETGAQASIALDRHAVPGTRDLRNDFRDEGDASFAARYLAGDPDQHSRGFSPFMYGP